MTFGPDEEEADANTEPKPAWYHSIFEGNLDDNFVLGLSLHNGQLEIMSKFETADILIATPLGMQKEANDDEDLYVALFSLTFISISLLSSIELLFIDQCDVIYMQNWETLLQAMEMLNHLPEHAMSEIDFDRVKDYFVYGLYVAAYEMANRNI